MATRHGLTEIAAIAAATASGLAKREIGVNPQTTANNTSPSMAAAIFPIALTGIRAISNP